jgi:hypothetical protein
MPALRPMDVDIPKGGFTCRVPYPSILAIEGWVSTSVCFAQRCVADAGLASSFPVLHKIVKDGAPGLFGAFGLAPMPITICQKLLAVALKVTPRRSSPPHSRIMSALVSVKKAPGIIKYCGRPETVWHLRSWKQPFHA